MSEPTVRWDRNGDLGEHGTVTVTDRNPATATTDLYKFAAVDRTRRKIHHYRNEEEKRRGGNRTHIDDCGPVAGLVLTFKSRRQIVHGRTAQGCNQYVPPHVASALFEDGATEVSAE